ncbi:MAG: hypothetical protein ACK4Z5_01245 [Brevundimonas sp.]
MTQTSINDPRRTTLTSAQRAAWARRGYLVLKGWLSPDEVAAAADAVDQATPARGGVLERLTERLQEPIADLLGEQPVLLSMERAGPEDFGLDGLNPLAATARGISAVVLLRQAWRKSWNLRFIPESHLIPAGGSGTTPGDEMYRLAEAAQGRGLEQHVLDAGPGDVWLRHPRLLRGALRRAAQERRTSWLKAALIPTTAVLGRPPADPPSSNASSQLSASSAAVAAPQVFR